MGPLLSPSGFAHFPGVIWGAEEGRGRGGLGLGHMQAASLPSRVSLQAGSAAASAGRFPDGQTGGFGGLQASTVQPFAGALGSCGDRSWELWQNVLTPGHPGSWLF